MAPNPTHLVVYELPLTDSGVPDIPGGYIYLPPPTEPPYIVRISIDGTASVCREGKLRINTPLPGQKFIRSHFEEHP